MANGVGVTYFGRSSVQFAELDHGHIALEPFLSACDGVVHFIGALGAAFAPVRMDVSGNVERIRKRCANGPRRPPPATVEEFVAGELHEAARTHTAAVEEAALNDYMLAVLWLARALLFVRRLLEEMIARSVHSHELDMAAMIHDAYHGTLVKHHGFVARQLFKVVQVAAPSYASVMRAVCDCDSPTAAHYDRARSDTQAYLVNFTLLHDALAAILSKLGLAL